MTSMNEPNRANVVKILRHLVLNVRELMQLAPIGPLVVGILMVFGALLLAARPAHAQAPAQEELHVSGGLVTAERTDDALVWNARWILAPEEIEDMRGGVLRFAIPLVEGETLKPASGLTPIVESGRVVGVHVEPDAVSGRAVSATFIQRAKQSPGGSAIHLGVPVIAGSAVQIIDGTIAGSSARLDIEPGGVLERHIGYVAPSGVSHAAREEARRLTGYRALVSGNAAYVRGEDVKANGGLVANVVTTRERASRGAIPAGVAFVFVVGALLVALRRLRNAASIERADALLEMRIEAAARHAKGAR
jgi:hypothetical protein